MPKITKQIFSWKMLIMFLMGASSGLPLALTGGTLKAWMTEAGVDLTTIGFFSLVGLPYTLKFLWSPFADRFSFPGFGRRRGWLLVSQAALIGCTILLAVTDPKNNTAMVAAIALALAFFSATQDIVLDAYRREILANEELGLGTSVFINGYIITMRLSSALALGMAQFMPWQAVYMILGGSLLIGMITVIFAPEPVAYRTPKTLREAFFEPFNEFFQRQGAFLILTFILLYKLGDAMASELTMPFYLQLGFQKLEVAVIVKGIGIWAMPIGALLGGVLMLRLGINRSLWIFGVLQALSTFGFAILAQAGPDQSVLAGVIGFENLTAGMGTAAFSAFMASLTNKQFTATQFALFSSLMGVPRVILSSPTGFMAERMGWPGFFTFCALIAIPGMLLLLKVAPWNGRAAGEVQEEASAPKPA